jgi:hypothetical protein
MMTFLAAIDRIDPPPRCWKHVLPAERTFGISVLARQCARKRHRAETDLQVARVRHAGLFDLCLQSVPQGSRQYGPAILPALALAHHDLAAIEVDILDPQAQAFHQPQAAAVQQPGHQCFPSVHRTQQRRRLCPGQHHR